MEFFHEPKIDWMGKKWYFIGLSIPLLLAGLVSMVVKRGLSYGIDFRGGTLVYVKFALQPNLDQLRAHLDRQSLVNATLQGYGAATGHEVIVGLDLKTTTSTEALNTGKRAIIDALSSLYGPGPEGKWISITPARRRLPIIFSRRTPWAYPPRASKRPQRLTVTWRTPWSNTATGRLGAGWSLTFRNYAPFPEPRRPCWRSWARIFIFRVLPSGTPRSSVPRWGVTCAAKPFT